MGKLRNNSPAKVLGQSPKAPISPSELNLIVLVEDLGLFF